MFGRGIALEPLIGTSPAQFEATKFLWLGSGTEEAAVVVIRAGAGIKTWADMLAKPFTVGGEGTGSDPDVYALMLKNVFGVKLRLVSGYPGTTEMALAVERGEVDGRASWSWTSLKSLKPDWIAQKKIAIPVQLNMHSSPDLQGRAADRRLRHDRAAAADHEARASAARSWAGRSWRRPDCRPIAPRRCGRRSTKP